MFGFGHMFPQDVPPSRFSTTYRCYSVSMLPGQDRKDVEKGGKIIMPPSALDTLTRLNIQYPMLFKLTNKRENRHTHSGVLEFVADEGRVYIPYWMMRNLLLEEGGLIQVESISMPVATFAKFQPQSVDFLDISNAKAVLENALRSFACLTVGDTIAINYNDRIYEMNVLDTRPANAVSIIETDMNVDFAPPVGYKEPERTQQAQQDAHDEEEPAPDVTELINNSHFRAFSGSGNRLDGKKKNTDGNPQPVSPSHFKRGVPNYNFKMGNITFIRAARAENGVEKEEETMFAPFSGSGQSLKKKSARSRKL